MHSHPEILGDKMKEWDASTKGRTLPNYSQSHAARKEEEQS